LHSSRTATIASIDAEGKALPKPDLALEAQLKELDGWLRGQGVARSTIHPCKSRIRAFARWLFAVTGEFLTPQAIGRPQLEAYREHMQSGGKTRAQIRSCLGSVRFYVRWAVTIGRLDQDPLRRRLPSVMGLDEFLVWLRSRGLAQATVDQYRARVLDYAAWYEVKEGKGLSPEGATPEDLQRYLQSRRDEDAGRLPRRSLCAVVPWYARWGEETGRLGADPFADLRWRDRMEIEAWLLEQAWGRHTRDALLGGIGQFARWYRQRKGRSLAPEVITAPVVHEYRDDLRAQAGRLSKQLIIRRAWAAKTYLKWAEQHRRQAAEARRL